MFQFTFSFAVNLPVGFVAAAIAAVIKIKACSITVPLFLPLQNLDIILQACSATIKWSTWVAFTVAWFFYFLTFAIAFKVLLSFMAICLLTVEAQARWAGGLVARNCQPNTFVVT